MMQSKSKLALAVLSALALPGLALAQDAAGKDKSKLKAVLSTGMGALRQALRVRQRQPGGATAGGVSAATLRALQLPPPRGQSTNFSAPPEFQWNSGTRWATVLPRWRSSNTDCARNQRRQSLGIIPFLGLEGGFGTDSASWTRF
jgi:hypothetical protein